MTTMAVTALLIEDNPDDAVLIQRYLKDSGNIDCKVIHFEKLSDGLAILSRVIFNIILLDLALPDAPSGIETFEKVYARASDVPIIVLTGHDDEELAVEAVQKGAQDYLVKGRVSGPLLGRAIRYAIERQKLVTQLEQSLKEIRKLRGFLPICASCKKIRDDKGYWTQLETYISSHSEAEFSHGICPDCASKLYPDLFPKGKGPE